MSKRMFQYQPPSTSTDEDSSVDGCDIIIGGKVAKINSTAENCSDKSKKNDKISTMEELAYPTSATLGQNMERMEPSENIQIGPFSISKNGTARMSLSSKRSVVVSTFRQNVYVHFFADKVGKEQKCKHFSMSNNEVDVFLENIMELKKHIEYQRKELNRCLVEDEQN